MSPLFVLGSFVLCSCVAGCSSSDPEKPVTPDQFAGAGMDALLQGTFTGAGGEGGSIEMKLSGGFHGATSLPRPPLTQTLHPLATSEAASGTLHFAGGATLALSGDVGTDASAGYVIKLTGGGYTISSTKFGGFSYGTFTGPKGSGVFTAVSAEGVKSYCGSFTGDAKGVWNFVVTGNGTLTGSASDDKGNPDTLSGRVTDGALSVSTKNGSQVMGMISGSTATGTYANGAVKGTWTAALGCN